MILAETADTLRTLYGKRLESITIKRAVVGLFFTGVQLSTGYGGISYTPAADIHKNPDFSNMEVHRLTPVSIFSGICVRDILNLSSYPPLLNTVRLAVLNALSAPLFLSERGRYEVNHEKDALHFLDTDRTRNLAMVGAISPFIRAIKTMSDIDLYVIEKKKQSLKKDEKKHFVPAKEAGKIIPFCDTVIITGAAIANGTIEKLLSFVKPDCKVIVAGPTVSFVPDALFSMGVSVVSGTVVTKIGKTLDILSEGGTARHLFETSCLSKINIIRNGKMDLAHS